jgi:hypothetical protein
LQTYSSLGKAFLRWYAGSIDEADEVVVLYSGMCSGWNACQILIPKNGGIRKKRSESI